MSERKHDAVQIFMCNPWEGYIASLVAASEREYAEHLHEVDLSIEAEMGPWPSMDGWTEESYSAERVPLDVACKYYGPGYYGAEGE